MENNMAKKKLVIFGIGKIGQVVHHHFATDSDFDIVGFTTDTAYVPQDKHFSGLPVVDFAEVEKHFAPKDHTLFVAIGYQGMNRIRAERLAASKQKGYATTSYISSQNKHHTGIKIGENCFIMSGEPLQPCTEIGDNNFIWTNALVGHHTKVGNHCWITSGVTIGGNCRIGDYGFFGLGATIGHEVTIGEKNLIGANALVTKDTAAEGVYIAADTERFRLTSSQFMKMTVMK